VKSLNHLFLESQHFNVLSDLGNNFNASFCDSVILARISTRFINFHFPSHKFTAVDSHYKKLGSNYKLRTKRRAGKAPALPKKKKPKHQKANKKMRVLLVKWSNPGQLNIRIKDDSKRLNLLNKTGIDEST
jgi:hypothetical protein